MRDKNRIKPLLDELEELWLQYPDMRFGQLVTMIFSKGNKRDIFFPEDDRWLEWIKKCKKDD